MTTAVAAPGVRRYTREDVVRLGSAAPPRPWEFLGVGELALRAAPADWGMRVLMAANYARLGLRTLAGEQLAALPDEVRGDGQVRGLAGAVGGMGDDRIGRDELLRVLGANLKVAAERGVDLRERVEEWAARGGEWWRAADGNVVRRVGGEVRGLGDGRGAAAAFGKGALAPQAAQVNVMVVEGVDPPWMLLEVAGRLSRAKEGYWPRLVVVQRDAMEFMDGLAQGDLRGVLGEERVVLCVGEGARERVREELRGRMGGRLSGGYVPATGLRARADVAGLLAEAEEGQVREHERLMRAVTGMYAGRDRAWWRKRFSGDGGPLRVLVPSCRYTTFVKHAAADLVAGFARIGCTAELLIEDDDSFRFSTVSYLRAIERVRPDVVVLVNYMRPHIGGCLPPELPVVSWIQDAMPHQFDSAVGAAQGEFDYLVGHVHAELAARFGYPLERSMYAPVATSEVKFHDGAVEAGLLKRHECEIALVSHHSETAAAMHERLVDEAGRGAPIQRVLEELRPEVTRLALDPMAEPVHARIEPLARETMRRHLGREPDAKSLTVVTKNYCLALADRVVRHQTLAWAAELARERGWRLHLYGRGWERHPEFGVFAKGELDHGEELRAAYQGATVHLHASINTLLHQRVMECALSGGLPLCRLIFESLRPVHMAAEWAAAGREAPTVCDVMTKMHGHLAMDHPEAAAFVGLRQRLGLPVDEYFWVWDKFRASVARGDSPPSMVETPARMLGDLGETTFCSKARLGELVQRAVESPAWRAGWSGFIAARVRERFTHAKFAERVLGLIRGSLGEGAHR